MGECVSVRKCLDHAGTFGLLKYLEHETTKADETAKRENREICNRIVWSSSRLRRDKMLRANTVNELRGIVRFRGFVFQTHYCSKHLSVPHLLIQTPSNGRSYALSFLLNALFCGMIASVDVLLMGE